VKRQIKKKDQRFRGFKGIIFGSSTVLLLYNIYMVIPKLANLEHDFAAGKCSNELGNWKR